MNQEQLVKNNSKYSVGFNIFRTIMAVLGCGMFVWFLLPFITFGILNPYNLLGMAVSVLVAVYFAFKPVFKKIRDKFYQKAFSKILWKLGRFLIYAFFLYGLVISTVMIICASIAPSQNASAIILGAQVIGDRPSIMLNDRITAGKNYLDKNPDAICVATGGLGNSANITEAQCMYNVLTGSGIDKNRIFLEESATNTQENLMYSYDIIKKQGASTDIAIVSDGFHQARALLIARKLGIDSKIGAVNANTNLIFLPTFWVREWFGLPYDALFR